MQLLAQVSSETDLYVAQNIFFAVIAVTMIYAAFRVVTTANVVHAALWLVVVLAGVACSSSSSGPSSSRSRKCSSTSVP